MAYIFQQDMHIIWFDHNLLNFLIQKFFHIQITIQTGLEKNSLKFSF